MNRSRISLLGVLTCVAIAALGIAALHFASDIWADGLFSIAALLIGVAILGAIYRRGERRAFWTGFALFGAGYLLVSGGPWFATEVAPHLATTQLLDTAHARVSPSPPANPTAPSVAANGTLLLTYNPVSPAPKTVEITATPQPLAPTPSTVNRVVLTTDDQASFRRIGHSLFALLSALVGGLIARRFARGSAPAPLDLQAAAGPS